MEKHKRILSLIMILITSFLFSCNNLNLENDKEVAEFLRKHDLQLDGDWNFYEDGTFEMVPASQNDPTRLYKGRWNLGKYYKCEECDTKQSREITLSFSNHGWETDAYSFNGTNFSAGGMVLEGTIYKKSIGSGWYINFKDNNYTGGWVVDENGETQLSGKTSFSCDLTEKSSDKISSKKTAGFIPDIPNTTINEKTNVVAQTTDSSSEDSKKVTQTVSENIQPLCESNCEASISEITISKTLKLPLVSTGDVSIDNRIATYLNCHSITRLTPKDISDNVKRSSGIIGLSYKINYNKGCLLSLSIFEDNMGAYEFQSSVNYNLNLNTGERITADIGFNAETRNLLISKCDSVIQKRLRKLLSEMPDAGNDVKQIINNIHFQPNDLESFIITKDGITFFYVYGFPNLWNIDEPDENIKLSFPELKGLLNPAIQL